MSALVTLSAWIGVKPPCSMIVQSASEAAIAEVLGVDPSGYRPSQSASGDKPKRRDHACRSGETQNMTTPLNNANSSKAGSMLPG